MILVWPMGCSQNVELVASMQRPQTDDAHFDFVRLHCTPGICMGG